MPQPEVNHDSNGSNSGYLGLYMSSKSRDKLDHDSVSQSKSHWSKANEYSTSGTSQDRRRELPKHDLRLDMLEKIMAVDPHMAVPHVRVVF